MAESRLRFGSSNGTASSPSRVPLARISEIYDPEFDPLPDEDQNHNQTARNGNPYLSRVPVDYEPEDQQQGRTGADLGCSPVATCAIAYFLAALAFLIFLNVEGLTLLPYPWIGNLLPYKYQQLNFFSGVVILQFMWCIHYIRRFAEVLFVHIYNRRMNFFETVGAQVYYFLFGLWAGWSVNFHLDYRVPVLGFFIPGIILFCVGEIGNCYSHVLLRRLRATPTAQTEIAARRRAIPHGFLFEYVTCPHYLFEIISWAGFYMSSHTIAGGIFLLATIVTVTIRAVLSHRSLKKEFHGKDGMPLYPVNRKAIIPYIL